MSVREFEIEVWHGGVADRGFERIEEKLSRCGAMIERVTGG